MNISNGHSMTGSIDVSKLQATVQALEGQLAACRDQQTVLPRVQQQFRFFSDHVQDFAFITFDAEARIATWSSGAKHIFGYSEADVRGSTASFFFTPEDHTGGEEEKELTQARSEGCVEEERWYVRRDGTRFWGAGIMTAHWDQKGDLEGYSAVMRDQTRRRLNDEQLRISEERLRLFSDNVTGYALVQVDAGGTISGWNTGAARLFGYPEGEMIGQSANCLLTLDDAAAGELEVDLERALAQGSAENVRWMRRQDGSLFWARCTTNPIRVAGQLLGFTRVFSDETERKRGEDQLRTSLDAKDVLLREVHHRVKNHLQVIASLLSMQANQTEDAQVQAFFDEMQTRISTIGSLHEALYGSKDLAKVEFGPYMRHIIHDLAASCNTSGSKVEVRVKNDDVVLSIEQALPLGLILNELVANAFKHGYPGSRRGFIDVSLRYLAGDSLQNGTRDNAQCELIVENDGERIGDSDSIWEQPSLGLRIVSLLTKQLGGSVHLKSGHGARFILRFPLES